MVFTDRNKKISIVALLLCVIFILFFVAWKWTSTAKPVDRPQDSAQDIPVEALPTIKPSPLIINEFLSSNRYGITDEDGDHADWIELFNPGDNTISLAGYGLSDDPDDPRQWIFPEVSIAAKGYLVVFASGKDQKDPTGAYLHTNFKIDRKGEYLLLTDPEGAVIEQVEPVLLPPDISYGRDAEDAAVWVYYPHPTPGEANGGFSILSLPIEEKVDAKLVVINEILASNRYNLVDEDGINSDWIEILNMSKEQINLKDYAISDSIEDPFRWRFPDISLDPGMTMLIFASGKDHRDPEHELHTDFSINRTSDILYFRDPMGRVIDTIHVQDHLPNVSYGKDKDKPEQWLFFPLPTPGEENHTVGFESIESMTKASILNQSGTIYNPTDARISLAGSFQLSHRGGFYAEPILLEIFADPGIEIRFTLDGSLPGEDSIIYTGPIHIDKTTVVRMAGVTSGELSEAMMTRTFFIGEHHTLPVISVAIDPVDFDHPLYGIYSTGPNASSEFPYMGANYHQDIEKPASFEFYEGNGQLGFRMEIGFKIFGGWTRAYAQKSFAIYARNRYENNEMTYPFLENKPLIHFKHLVLRTSGQDVFRTKFRDILVTDLIKDTGMDYQGYRQAVLYINGKYWGIYNLREKINRYFFHYNHGIEDLDTVDILEGNSRIKAGTNEDYFDMMNFVVRNDLRMDSNYEILQTRMDVQNYMDFQILQMYIANIDNGNIRYWRERTEGGKWRWIVYDTDLGFQSASHDTVWFIINPAGTGHGTFFDNRLIRHLLRNASFRKDFIERFAWHLHHTFDPDHIIERIDALSDKIAGEMEKNVTRWERPRSVAEWTGEVEQLRSFARQRPNMIIRHLEQHLKLTAQERALFQ